MPPDRIAAVLQDMAGGHLNRQLLFELRQLVPSYPVGHWVTVTAGCFAGWRGVVTAVHRGRVDEPSLRLLLDADGEAVASPVELDTRTVDDIELACLGSDQAPTVRRPALAV